MKQKQKLKKFFCDDIDIFLHYNPYLYPPMVAQQAPVVAQQPIVQNVPVQNYKYVKHVTAIRNYQILTPYY